MTTLSLQIDDDLNAFAIRESNRKGYPSVTAYIESLLTLEQMRSQSDKVSDMLQEAIEKPGELLEVDDDYWKRLDNEVFGAGSLEHSK